MADMAEDAGRRAEYWEKLAKQRQKKIEQLQAALRLAVAQIRLHTDVPANVIQDRLMRAAREAGKGGE